MEDREWHKRRNIRNILLPFIDSKAFWRIKSMVKLEKQGIILPIEVIIKNEKTVERLLKNEYKWYVEECYEYEKE
jgi:hypothetical protein